MLPGQPIVLIIFALLNALLMRRNNFSHTCYGFENKGTDGCNINYSHPIATLLNGSVNVTCLLIYSDQTIMNTLELRKKNHHSVKQSFSAFRYNLNLSIDNISRRTLFQLWGPAGTVQNTVLSEM